MLQSALIIVPHPDDEINIAGGLFEQLISLNVYITVVICSNGDFVKKNSVKRINESLKVQKIFGFNDLIFLGYGDNYQNKHIYDLSNDEIAVSTYGVDETYCVGGLKEFCFNKHGYHHKYTRDNIKTDIREVILDKLADMIVCVDNDCHPDHRCISLLFDEVIGEVLKEIPSYHPTILKSFAYLGVWHGAYDFFSKTIKPTLPCYRDGKIDVSLSYPYLWSQRIRIKNPENFTSLKLWRNKLFKSFIAYKTQWPYAMGSFPRVANPDSCYWYRSSHNLALHSKISASSGDVQYINDFLIIKPLSVRGDFKDFYSNSLCWVNDCDDKKPFVEFHLHDTSTIQRLVIYQHCDTRVDEVEIVTDAGYKANRLCVDCNILDISIPPCTCKSIRIYFISYKNDVIAIDEIELYDKEEPFSLDTIPLIKYTDESVNRSRLITVPIELLYNFLFRIWSLFEELCEYFRLAIKKIKIYI